MMAVISLLAAKSLPSTESTEMCRWLSYCAARVNECQGMVGFAYNAVTCLNIVFSIGLAVDFTMHITHAYLHSSGTLQVSNTSTVMNDITYISLLLLVGTDVPFLRSSCVLKLTLSAAFSSSCHHSATCASCSQNYGPQHHQWRPFNPNWVAGHGRGISKLLPWLPAPVCHA